VICSYLQDLIGSFRTYPKNAGITFFVVKKRSFLQQKK